MKLGTKMPCSACPFRRKSLAGWLGAATPEEFIESTMADADMPCHKTVNYENEAWEKTLKTDSVHYCAGSIIFLRNTCKLSMNKEKTKLPPDHKLVFSNKMEFLEHHERISN